MTKKRISVIVFKPAGRAFFQAQWVDPRTGKKKTLSTGTAIKREAEREAARIEEDLRNFRTGDPTRTSWASFRERYIAEHATTLGENTRKHIEYMFNTVDKLVGPATVAEMDASAISTFKLRMRDWTDPVTKRRMRLRETSVLSQLKTLRAALGWAKRVGIMTTIPEIQWPKDAEQAGGRPITGEEFERVIVACNQICGAGAPPWRHLLNGLWWSGLRINEAMHLHWTNRERLCVDLEGSRPMFRIAKEFNKSRKTERFPMSPEFHEFLMQTETVDRVGYVFNPERRRGSRAIESRITTDCVSEAIADMGRLANVKTKDFDDGTPVFASAHDFRRSFGSRWAKRVMPAVLQRLMRHKSIKTTMTYYATQDEDQTANAVWGAYEAQVANTFASTSQKVPQSAEKNAKSG